MKHSITWSSCMTRSFADTLSIVWGCIPLTWSSDVITWNAGINGMLMEVELISYWPTASSTVAWTWIDPVTAEMVNVLSVDATDSIMHWYSPLTATTQASATNHWMADTTDTQTHTHSFNGPLSRTTRVSQYQKGKPIWILLKQETVSGSGICWAICKSAPHSRQITMPAPHHSVF